MQNLDRNVKTSFKILCSWIGRYDERYSKFNNFNLGTFKRYYSTNYTILENYYKNALTCENMIRFFVFMFSKLKVEDLNYGILKILNQLISKKFCIANRTAKNHEIDCLTKLKNDFICSKKQQF